MKIAFFTEIEFRGKVRRDHSNMRTEFAWMCALNADHYPINTVPNLEYDLGVVIVPKKNPLFNLENIKEKCKKVAVMQEGPSWYFQDYTLENQINYYNTLIEADIIFTHNLSDKDYYTGLTKHPDVRVLPSLMIEDAIGNLEEVKREGVIIGGNFASWYGGFDSYSIASEIAEVIYAPSMGRKQTGEEYLVNHLPYMMWKEWMHKLNEFKIGVHLMRTHAAGTFALNCAYLGIPCIGYEGLDTQQLCHPDLTIKLGDLPEARKLIRKLNNEPEFYTRCSKTAVINYKKYFHENIFNTTFKEQFEIS